MAILNAIRKRTAFLIIIIALALFAFVFTDLIDTSGNSAAKVVDKIGQVGDKSIDRIQFAQNVEALVQQSQGRTTTMQAVNRVWDAKVEELALEEEFETLGIEVGRDQIITKLSELLAGNPNFSNEEGFFDEAVMNEFLANMTPEQKAQWSNYEKSIENQIRKEIYLSLVKAGVGATLLEAEQEYKFQTDNVSFQVVRIPFDKAENVEVTSSEIEAYIKEKPAQFKQEPQRDIQYVLFENKASKADEDAIEADLKSLIEDFKKTDNAQAFVNDNGDQTYNASFKFENQLPAANKEELLALELGDVFGPYRENNVWKATKFEATQKMPDSAKASHILISTRAQNVQRTQEEAKALADSLFEVVKANPSKLGELAKEFSTDTGSAAKEGDLGWNPYGRFVPEFNEAVFTNKPGYIGLVETQFGFHIIKLEELSAESTMYKFADLTLEIKPSDATLSDVYRDVGNFQLDAQEKGFTEVASEKDYILKPVLGIKALEEQIPGLGAQRQIVNWAFNEETAEGDIKQFDIGSGYVVVQLNRIIKEGLQTAQQASAKVTPILEKKKKAEALLAQINSTDLNEIATQFGVSVQNVSAVNMESPLVPGAGQEPKVVGAAFALEQGETSEPIVGEKGVFVVQLTNRVDAPENPSYKAAALRETQRRIQQLQGANNSLIKALKASKDIEDNRSEVY
jgi:peptidylprolyl isomerase/peptidyl-prolyl cis-trans isomerase D